MSEIESRPVDVACALIERDGRVLVAQRPPHKALGLKWEFPGGKIECGETGAQALIREIREELGLAIEIVHPLPEVRHAYDRFSIRLTPFVCRALVGEAVAHEHVAVRWCVATEIEKLDLAAADLPVLRDYRAWLRDGRAPRAN